MNEQLLDAKLKNLIQICKETENYKKLAVVSFILTSNRVNEIGINLGVRPRNKSLGEKIFEYMELINEIFEENLRVYIFQTSHIETVRACEMSFLKHKGSIPLEYIKQMFAIYYELRQLEVPNLHKAPNDEMIMETSSLGPISLFTSGTKRKKKDSNVLKPLILQKIVERERTVRKNLQRGLHGPTLETAIHLKSIKKSLAQDKKGKVTIRGALKDNLTYQRSLESVYGYLLLGLILLFASLGVVILIELSFASLYSSDLSSWVLVMFAFATVLIYIYIKQFRRGK